MVHDTAQTQSELSMSYRPSPHPRWPAAQAEATVGAGGSAGLDMLDTVALNRLRELDPGGHSGLLNRVLRTYTLSLDRFVVQWQASRAAGDATTMRTMAHTLKSSSASVGALDLSTLCADVEARLRDEPLQGVEAQVDAVAAEAERILNGLAGSYRAPQ